MEKILKKLKDNKGALIGVLVGLIIVVVALVTVVILLITSGGSKITCTKELEFVQGIDLNEELVVTLKKNKVNRIKLDKTVTLDKYYQQYETFGKIINEHIQSSYKYLDEKDYKVESAKDKINITLDTKKNGVILNNLNVTKAEGSTRDDISINSSNVLETSSSALKIDDEYKAKELKKVIEGYGYKCKK